jgi:DNA-binding GntR family transcriptional regulator
MPHATPARRDAPASLAQRAYEALRDRLHAGAIRPGDLLNRRAVAASLGMSVAPVLEAMLWLEADGILETLPRKGTRVRVGTREDVRGQLIVREALECAAARLYRGAPVRRAAPRLRSLARQLDANRVGSPSQWQRELDFHRALVELAGCPALLDAFDRIMWQGLFYAVTTFVEDATRTTRDSHVDLLRKLQTADPDAAERAIRAHLRAGKEPILEGPARQSRNQTGQRRRAEIQNPKS